MIVPVYSAGELAGLSEAQRRAIVAALVLSASADGAMDPREIAVVRPLLEGAPWGVGNEVIALDTQHAQALARTVRGPNDVAALGAACAQVLPTPAAREKLVNVLLAIAWADGVLRPEEQWVLAAFMRGLGLSGERANELCDAAADDDPFSAVARGRVDVVRRHLDAGTPVMSRDPRQWTLLHVAVATGQAAIVDLLLERGADVHAKHGQGSPPLFLACNKPYEAIVERLLRAGAKVDEAGAAGLTPLLIASLMGQTGVARALRKGGASLEIRDASGRTPLHCAASEGRGATVAFLLAEGAAVEARTAKGVTPLILAADRGDLPCVTALLAARAAVHAADVDGQTALHYAVNSNQPPVVALLLALGANASAASAKQVTPLHVAAGAGFTACAKLLLDAGAPVDARNVEGGTPLFMAAVRDRREVHDLLVARGADLDAKTSFGTTPRASVGLGLTIKSLRSAPLVEPLPPAALRPDDAVLASFDGYWLAVWMNEQGTRDQVLVAGQDARGRPQYVARAKGDARARTFVVTDRAGKRWLPLFTSDAAAAAFRRATPIGWPEDGMGIAAAVLGGVEANMFELGDLPIDGVIVNPYGPNGPVTLTSEECNRVARRVGR